MADYYTQQYDDMNQSGFTGLAEPVRPDVVRSAVSGRMQKDIDAGTANGIVGDIEEPNFVQKVQYRTGVKEIPDGAQAEKNKVLPPGPPLRETDYSAPELQWHKKQRPAAKPAPVQPVRPVQRKAACVLPRIAQEKSAEVRTELFTPREVYNRVYGGKEKFDAALANAKAYRAAHPELKADWDLQDFSVLDTKVPYTTYNANDKLDGPHPALDQNGKAPPPEVAANLIPLSHRRGQDGGWASVWRPDASKPETYRGIVMNPLVSGSYHSAYTDREDLLRIIGHETSHILSKPGAGENPKNLFGRYDPVRFRGNPSETNNHDYWFNPDEVSANLGAYKQLLSRYGTQPGTKEEWSSIIDNIATPGTHKYEFIQKLSNGNTRTGYQGDSLGEKLQKLKEKNPAEYQRIRNDLSRLAPGYVSTYNPVGSKHASVDSFISGIEGMTDEPDHKITVTKVLGMPVPAPYGKATQPGGTQQQTGTATQSGSPPQQQQTGMPTWLKYALGGGLVAGGLLATTAMLSDDDDEEDEEEVLKRKRRARMLAQA